MESDIRFYRRRAHEELAAANRAVTESARERRMILAGVFFERLRALENFEAMTFGPRLSDGRTSLLLLSDDNFSARQVTAMLVLGLPGR